MSKPIMVSNDNYDALNTMRRHDPVKKEYESFNDVVTRLLHPETNGVPK